MSLKIKLVSCIVAFCMILSLLVVGVFAVRNTTLNVGGSIKFTATGIKATINNASVTGSKNSDENKNKLGDLKFTTTTTEVGDVESWSTLALEFQEVDGEVAPVVISFDITNDHETDMLYVYSEVKDENDQDISMAKTNFAVATSINDSTQGSAGFQLPAKVNNKVTFTIKIHIGDPDLDVKSARFNVKIGLYSKVPDFVPDATVDGSNVVYENVKYTKTNRTLSVGRGSGVSGEVIIPRVLKITEGGATYLYTVTKLMEYAFYGDYVDFSVVIPDTVTEIGNGALSNTGLTKIVIGSNVETMNLNPTSSSDGPITYNTSLISIESNSGRFKTYGSNVLIDEQTKTLFASINGNVKIPTNKVEKISACAFGQCVNLTEITIPDSVTSIGLRAFYCCKNLKSVTIGDGIETIGDGAFSDCDILNSITIGAGIKTIGKEAFSCKSLKTLTIEKVVASGADVPTLGENAFRYYDNGYETADVTIRVPSGSGQYYSADPNWSSYKIEEY